MKNILFVLLAGTLLCSCSSTPVSQAPEPTQTETIPATSTWTSTSEPTNTTTPTATATLVSLSEIDLGAIIYQEGDVPELFSIVELPGASAYLVGNPAPDYIDYVNLRIPGTDNGISTNLGIYEDAESARAAYQILSAGAEPTTAFGEQAFTSTNIINDEMFGMILMSQLAFLRCHAVVSMTMVTFDYSEQTWSDPAIIAKYAITLDARLREIACR